MNIETMLFLIVIGFALWGIAEYLKMRSEVKHLRHELANLTNQAPPTHHEPLPTSEPITAAILPGAGQALAKPPTSLQATFDRLRGEPAYTFPLGWYVGASSGRVILQTAKFTGDVNHILVTGQSDSGKDNAALNILLSLAATHTPERLQVAIVDGKGLDWIGWQHKAHCWHLATDPEHISDAMQKLSAERKRRREILAAAGVSKWDNYQGGDMPLLVVFISELLLLENAVGKANLTSWLNAELTAARAFGLRYIIACQNASNFSTQWRSQISLFLAGFQTSDSADMPNTGLYTKEISERGVLAPSNLPSPGNGAGGVFLALQGGAGVNVRTSLITDHHRDHWLKQLPNKPTLQAILQNPSHHDDTDLLHEMLGASLLIPDDYVLEDETPATGHLNAVEAHSKRIEAHRSVSGLPRSIENLEALPVSTTLIPESEQRRIIAAAKNATSRRQVCKELYNSTGGTGYKNIAMVCDALGLLVPTGGAVVMQ